MNAQTQNYYRLCELFDVSGPVQKALSAYFEGKMKKKVGESYQHTLEWWQPRQSLMSRTPFVGSELITFLTNGPDNWGMNLVLKAVKYCNHDLLVHDDTEWKALDSLIATRENVFGASNLSITNTDSSQAFQDVQTALGTLYTATNMQAQFPGVLIPLASLQQKQFGADQTGKDFHDHLVKQKQEWEEFSAKLYERDGMPTLVQLQNFHGNGDFNIIQGMASQYRYWGSKMLKDDNGHKVGNISTTVAHLGDPVKIATNIITDWLGGKGITPTWANLLACLRSAELNVLAGDIEEKLI